MVLTEAQNNLRKKGYPEADIDIWTAGYEFARTQSAEIAELRGMLSAANAISFDDYSTLIRMLDGTWGVRTGNLDGTVMGDSLLEAFTALKESK